MKSCKRYVMFQRACFVVMIVQPCTWLAQFGIRTSRVRAIYDAAKEANAVDDFDARFMVPPKKRTLLMLMTSTPCTRHPTWICLVLLHVHPTSPQWCGMLQRDAVKAHRLFCKCGKSAVPLRKFLPKCSCKARLSESMCCQRLNYTRSHISMWTAE